ncbi:iron-containing alcohol dehydrogenase [Lacrimispora sp.]|uniref:iron-containing alcohol dehydrogenase n=1 Tax=Lacrimispora sp. TaxID=2719234 RepID=UPI00289F4CA2|nr:iron-containing alcohol dehydrogenase [Lacrimispora sp.]
MENFEFYNPTKVIFGKGAETRVGAEIASRGFKKVMVHFGGTYLSETGVLDRIHESLKTAGIEYVDFGGVVPNPRLSHVKEGVALCKKESIDFILGVGGGSAIDSSKAIAYGLANEFDLEDLFMGKTTTTRIAPVGCITTIAATGSETSNSTVVTIETKDRGILKRSYNHDCARPLFAAMNPELTYTLPDYQTASGGADIMMHTMERYFTQAKDVELSDRVSEGLLVTVRDTVGKALKNPQDYEARANLMWAGSLSHNGLTGTGRINDFPVHKIGHELSAMFDATHGASLTSTWATWAKTVYKSNPARFARFAVKVFGVELNFDNLEETALAGIEAWERWCKSIGMPTTLTELGCVPTEAQIEEMAEKAASTGGGRIGLFHSLDKKDLADIYRRAL